MHDIDRILLAASVALLILAGVVSLSLAVVPGFPTVDSETWLESHFAEERAELASAR